MNNCNAIWFASIVGLLMAGCYRGHWKDNPTGELSVRERVSDNLVYLELRSNDTMTVFATLPTHASAMHKWKSEWILDNCILFDSSDIGLQFALVDSGCAMFWPKEQNRNVKWREQRRIDLRDEEYNSVGSLIVEGTRGVFREDSRVDNGNKKRSVRGRLRQLPSSGGERIQF